MPVDPLATEPSPEIEGAARREELISAIDRTMRLLGSERMRLTHALAERLGIPPSDLECLELAYLRGGVTVGALAAARGVTLGAVSQSLNRLEAKELSRREPDPADRRRTIVHVRPAAVRRIAPVYDKLREAMVREWYAYSEEELETAQKVMSRGALAISEQTSTLIALPAGRSRAAGKTT